MFLLERLRHRWILHKIRRADHFFMFVRDCEALIFHGAHGENLPTKAWPNWARHEARIGKDGMLHIFAHADASMLASLLEAWTLSGFGQNGNWSADLLRSERIKIAQACQAVLLDVHARRLAKGEDPAITRLLDHITRSGAQASTTEDLHDPALIAIQARSDGILESNPAYKDKHRLMTLLVRESDRIQDPATRKLATQRLAQAIERHDEGYIALPSLQADAIALAVIEQQIARL